MRFDSVLIIIILVIVLFLNFYSFNNILLQPADSFDVKDTLAPIGASLEGTNRVDYDESKSTYYFYYTAPGDSRESVRYEIDVSSFPVSKGVLKIYEAISKTYPVLDGGVYYRNNNGTLLNPTQFSNLAQEILLTHNLSGKVLSLEYRDSYQGFTRQKRYEFEIKGKTLILKAYALNNYSGPNNNYAGLSFEKIGNVTSARVIQVPYMKTAPISLVNNQYFISTYVDWLKSNSNSNIEFRLFPSFNSNNYTNSFGSRYIGGSGLAYPQFSEVAYITISENAHDTLMGLNRDKSPYRDSLNNKVALHIWDINHQRFINNSNPGGRYVPNAISMIQKLYGYGLENLFVTLHSSQYLHPTLGLATPTVCPISTWYGNQQSIKEIKDLAISYGYAFAPIHDNRIDMFQPSTYWNGYCDSNRTPVSPDSPDFPIAIDYQGKCMLSGWYDPSYSSSYFYVIASDKRLNYAISEFRCLNQTYGLSNAHYLDVSSKTSFSEVVDYSPFMDQSSTIAKGLENNRQMNEFIHSQVQGPIVAEGGEHSLYTIDTFVSGSVDAFTREINGREDAPVIPDFELMQVKPLSANQGMGTFGRWIRQPIGNPAWTQAINLTDFAKNKADKYRSTVIAFGHAALFDDEFLYVPESYITLLDFYNYFVKDYYIFSELQELYLSSKIEKIEYYQNNSFMTLSQILTTFNSQSEQNSYFVNSTMLRLTYENGLIIYVNRHLSLDWNISINGKRYYLPANGWLAYKNNSNFLAYSALVDSYANPSPTGNRVDYVYSDNYIMMNPRGTATSFSNDLTGTYTTTYMAVIKSNGWMLSENSSGGFIVSNLSYCGDSYCSNTIGETCSTCSSDCGACSGTSSGSGSSGGSSGGSSSGGIGGTTSGTTGTNGGNSNSELDETISGSESEENPLGSNSENSKDKIIRPVLYTVIVAIIIGIILVSLKIFNTIKKQNRVNGLVDNNIGKNNFTY